MACEKLTELINELIVLKLVLMKRIDLIAVMLIWIRIHLGLWIRFRIPNADPDPDPEV